MLIVFYLGYSPNFNNENFKNQDVAKNIGGSEYAALYLSNEMAKLGHEVHVFGFGITEENSRYHHASKLSDFCMTREIDALIISRYINAFLHCQIRAKKIYVWVHDIIVHSAYNGQHLPSNAGVLLHNLLGCIDGISAQGNWHEAVLGELYPFAREKIFKAPNGIDSEIFDMALTSSRKKIPNTFVWAAHHSRGLVKMMELWSAILAEIPDAKLFIYGDSTDETKIQLEAFLRKNSSSVMLKGKVPHTKLFEKMLEVDYWVYPTEFSETFCMIALEAQLAGCKCVCSKLAGLVDTVGDYGILLDNASSTPQMWVSSILEMKTRPEEFYINMRNHAAAQTWASRAEDWISRISM